jgi:hypothetical protein
MISRCRSGPTAALAQAVSQNSFGQISELEARVEKLVAARAEVEHDEASAKAFNQHPLVAQFGGSAADAADLDSPRGPRFIAQHGISFSMAGAAYEDPSD